MNTRDDPLATRQKADRQEFLQKYFGLSLDDISAGLMGVDMLKEHASVGAVRFNKKLLG